MSLMDLDTPPLPLRPLRPTRLSEELSPQRRNELLDLRLFNSVVLEGDLELEALYFDAALSFVLEDAGVGSARVVGVLEVGWLVERVSVADGGEVSDDVACRGESGVSGERGRERERELPFVPEPRGVLNPTPLSALKRVS